MRAKSWVVVAGLVLVPLIAVPARAAVNWSAPGWYAYYTDFFGTVLDQGPFRSKAECKAAIPSGRENEWCAYFGH